MDYSETPIAVRQPLPSEPVPDVRRPRRRPRFLGEVRLPIAGPYHPRARLYELPDGRRLWTVRLWEYDRPVPHAVGTHVLLAFARRNGLLSLAREVERLAAPTSARVADGPE